MSKFIQLGVKIVLKVIGLYPANLKCFFNFSQQKCFFLSVLKTEFATENFSTLDFEKSAIYL